MTTSNGETKTIELTLHTEGNTIYAIADDATIWGSSSGRNSCLYETACRLSAAGYTDVRIDGGDSLAVATLLAQYDPFAAPPAKRRR